MQWKQQGSFNLNSSKIIDFLKWTNLGHGMLALQVTSAKKGICHKVNLDV